LWVCTGSDALDALRSTLRVLQRASWQREHLRNSEVNHNSPAGMNLKSSIQLVVRCQPYHANIVNRPDAGRGSRAGRQRADSYQHGKSFLAGLKSNTLEKR
jgi:hypothetical protein